MIVEIEKSSKISDSDGSYLIRSSLTKTKNRNYPQAMHDMVQASKCDSTILWSFGTCKGVEALQHQLMFMSGSRNSIKPLELDHIWFLLHNSSICIISPMSITVCKIFGTPSVTFQTFKILLMTKFKNLLQFIRLHANLSHQTRVGNVHIS